MRALSISEWRTLQNAQSTGNRVLYWSTLANAGDSYAKLALQVATDSTVAGRAANRYLIEEAKAEGHFESDAQLNQIGVDLTQADFDARLAAVGALQNTSLIFGASPDLSVLGKAPTIDGETVYEYHESVFSDHGLSRFAWTLSPLLEVFRGDTRMVDAIFSGFLAEDTLSKQFTGGIELNQEVAALIILNDSARTAPEVAKARQLLVEKFGSAFRNPNFGRLDAQQLAALKSSLSVTDGIVFDLAVLLADPYYIQPGLSPHDAKTIGQPSGYWDLLSPAIRAEVEADPTARLANFNVYRDKTTGAVNGYYMTLALQNGRVRIAQVTVVEDGAVRQGTARSIVDPESGATLQPASFEIFEPTDPNQSPTGQATIGNKTISFGSLGSLFGSNLARLIDTGNDPWAGLAVGTVLGTIALNIGQEIDHATNPEVVGFKDFPKDIEAAGIGAIGSYLFAQLVDVIGIHGFPGQAIDSLGGAVIGQIAQNIANGAATFANITDMSVIGNAFGSFLGSWLASQVIQFDTIEGQIGASLGSAVTALVLGDFIGGEVAALGAEFGVKLGSLAGPIGALIGAFVGFIVGGLIGSLFGGTPRSGADIGWNGKEFAVGKAWAHAGGSSQAAQSMASSVVSALNSILAATGSKVLDAGAVRTGSYGTRKKDYVYWAPGTTDGRNLSEERATYASPDDLIAHGTYVALSDLVKQLAGGDVYVKRALAATLSAANGNATALASGTAGAEGQFSTDTLLGNIKVAQDYESYLSNLSMINALLAAEPQSTFSATWLATIAQAMDLGLDRRAYTDWIGGWAAFLDESKGGAIDGNAFTPANLSVQLDAATNERTFVFSDDAGNFLGAFGDTVDSSAKTLVGGTSGNDTITIGGANGDTIANTSGLTIDGVAGTGAAKTIRVAAVVDAGAGDDVVQAGDLGSDVKGGDGNDTLVGGKLDDWLLGDAGNDRLFAGGSGTGLNTNFADTDTASINAALAADGGNGNYLEGGAGDDRLYGGKGSDWLSGGDGSDKLYGGAGGDVLGGGSGLDQLSGGDGSDQYVFGFGDGQDTIFDVADPTAAAGTTGDSLRTYVSTISSGPFLQRNWAGDGNYETDGSVKGGSDAVAFGPGITMANVRLSRSGNDLVVKLGSWDADYANFTLTGDQLTLQDWFDTTRRVEWFRFANGEDIRVGDFASFTVITGSTGNDQLIGTNGNDFIFGLAGNDKIRALSGNDFGYGGPGDDFITGDDGNDLIVGGSGNDQIQGGNGDDTLSGDGGSDSLYGGAGNDILSGGRPGPGGNWLVGGAGNDIFKIARGDGGNVVMDDYANNWDVVYSNNTYQNGYTLNPDGTVSKGDTTYYDGSNWTYGLYTYDVATRTLKRFIGALNGKMSQNSGTDTLEFAPGIDIQDLQFSFTGTDLIIGIGSDENDTTAFSSLSDVIDLPDWYSLGSPIENFSFAETGQFTMSNWALGPGHDNYDDTISGGTGSDWITGLSGDDNLSGNNGNDILVGDSGNDTLKGGAGTDILYGGAGEDTLDGGAAADKLFGGAGEDTASYNSAAAAVRVSLGYTLANSGDALGDTFSGIEDLTGTTLADTLIGDDGGNVIRGGLGNDTVRGGLGNDIYVYKSGDGNDVINDIGISGAEEVLSAEGVLNPAYRADWTYIGPSGSFYAYRLIVTKIATGDTVYKSRDNVDFLLSAPNLPLQPASGWNVSAGQFLLDTARTGSGIQAVRTLDGVAGGDDSLLLEGLSLSDLTASRSGADVTLTVTGGATIQLKNQTDSTKAVENLMLTDGLTANLTNLCLPGDAATAANDLYLGNSSANTFDGGDGDDVISGGGGADILSGGAGNDTLEGGAGADRLDGGSDSVSLGQAIDSTNPTKPYGDTIRYTRSSAGVTVNLQTSTASGGDAAGDVIVSTGGISTIENVVGSIAGADILTGDNRANRLAGLDGNDTLTGLGGDDVLIGGAGNDTLDGGDGNDSLSGQDGNDIVHGGTGNDVIDGGAGANQLFGDAGDDFLSGGGDVDTMYGGAGDDKLSGGASGDFLYGEDGNDAISGGDGYDELHGGAGNDVLSGDSGGDTLYGEAGDDTYLFNGSSGLDTVVDADGQNRISIAGVTSSQIWLARSGDDLVVSTITSGPTGGSQISIQGYYASTTPSRIVSIAAADKTLFLAYAEPLIAAMTLESIAPPSNAMPASIAGMLSDYWDQGTTAAPRVADQSYATNEDTPVTGAVNAVDHDGNITGYSVATAPGHGTLSLDPANGTWTYTPSANYNGSDQFQLRVTDGDGQSATQAVSVTLAPVPDPPSSVVLTQVIAAIPERDRPDPASTVPAIQVGLLSGTDPDLTAAEAAQQLVYSVSDTRFEIRNGNELWLKAGQMSSIDFETSPTVSVPVTVSDNFGSSGYLSLTQPLTIAVSDQTDYYDGGAGADTITGGPGRDIVRGFGGDDVLSGGNGDDDILGGSGNDTLNGDAGNDYLQGLDGNDQLFGGDGNDTLTGDDGTDTLTGGLGNDSLDGGAGDDWLDGGAGADTVQGGSGNDTLSYASSGSGVTVNLQTGIGSSGDALGDTVSGIETLIGSDYADNLTGTSAIDNIFGGAGNDTITGGGGGDNLHGGAGDDVITGSGSLYGEAGNDTLVGSAGVDILDGGDGNDYLQAMGNGDTLIGGAGDDIMDGGTGSDGYVLDSNSGNDRIRDFDPTGTDVDQINYNGVDASWLWFERVGNDMKISIIGSTASVVVEGWYATVPAPGNRRVEMFLTGTRYTIDADGLTGLMATHSKPANLTALATLMADVNYLNTWTAFWGANKAPTLNPIANQSTQEDVGLAIPIVAADDLTPASQLTYTVQAFDDAALTHLNTTLVGAASVNPATQVLSIAPAANRSGTVYVQVKVFDLTSNVGTQTFALTVNPVADVPSLTTPPNVVGTLDGGSMPLSISADLLDTDGSETLQIQVLGLPAALSLNHGVNQGGGTWFLTKTDLSGLAITGPTTWSNDFSLTVRAKSTEAGNGSTATSTDRTIGVTVNARPTAITGSLSVNENSANGTIVGTLTGVDPDNDTLTYMLTDNAGGRFQVNSAGLVTVLNGSLLDYESASSASITARATDPSGLYKDVSLTVTINNVDEAPTNLQLANTTTSLNENTSTAARIKLADISFSDDALGTNNVYLTGNNAGSFEVGNFGSGLGLYLRAGVSLDFETQSSYQVRVNVDDSAVGPSPDLFQDFTLNVGNVNEAPVTTNPVMSVAEYPGSLPAQTTVAHGALSTDPDADGSSWDRPAYEMVGSWGPFSMAANGTITVQQTLDYDDPSQPHSYNLQYRAWDGGAPGLGSPSAIGSLTINVTNVDDAPYVASSNVTGGPGFAPVNARLQLVMADPEGDPIIVNLTGIPQFDPFNYSPYSPDWSVTGQYLNIHWSDLAQRGSGTFVLSDAGGASRTYTFSVGMNIQGSIMGPYYTPTAQWSPVVLDLDGNGLDLRSFNDPTAPWFDLNGDGFADKTGWVGPGDGILAIDRNGDGQITTGDEISFTNDVNGAVSDLEGLNAYDTNQNGLIDAGDEKFATLTVWRDANQDGVSQADELASLSDLGIQSINLTMQPTGASLDNFTDNVIYATSQFTLNDGSTRTVGDVALAIEPIMPVVSITEVPAGQLGPIVVDLNGDGVSLKSRTSSTTMFDTDNSGARQKTGWVGPNDGLLALDRNGDGKIDTGSEISFKDDVPGAVSDLEGLSAYDTNGNGLFDAGDAKFADFQIWRDGNQDGISQPGELKRLSSYGITAINLTLNPTGQKIEGATDNVLYATTEVVHSDGTIGVAGDVFLSYDEDSAQPASLPVSTSLPSSQLPGRPRSSHPATQADIPGDVAKTGENGQAVKQGIDSLDTMADGGQDDFATSLAADHDVGAQSPIDAGLGVIDRKVLQMVSAMSTFNSTARGNVDFANHRQRSRGNEFLTALPDLHHGNTSRVA